MGLVLLVACAVASSDGEKVSIPVDKHANLDPISLLEMEERANAQKEADLEGEFRAEMPKASHLLETLLFAHPAIPPLIYYSRRGSSAENVSCSSW